MAQKPRDGPLEVTKRGVYLAEANLRGRFSPSNTTLRSGHRPEDPMKGYVADRSVPKGFVQRPPR